MSSVAERIPHLENHLEPIIAEIASLKLATGNTTPHVRGDVDYVSLYNPPPAPPEPVKELYVLYDFETNGLGKTDGIRICQVGAVALDQNMREIATFNEFVNPLVAIDPGATAVNGIDADFVSKKPGWNIVGQWFNDWIEEHRGNGIVNLVAHNGKR